MISGAVVVSQLTRLGFFGDLLFCLSDQMDAEEDNGAGEELSRALDGHEGGPVGGALANRLDLAQLLHVLQAYEDHSEEHSDNLKGEDPDDKVDAGSVLVSVFIVVQHLVDGLDQFGTHHNIDNDQNRKPC